MGECHCDDCNTPADPVCSVCNEDGKPMAEDETPVICEDCNRKHHYCQRRHCGGEMLTTGECDRCGK